MHFWRTVSLPRNNSMQVDVSKRYLKVVMIRTWGICKIAFSQALWGEIVWLQTYNLLTLQSNLFLMTMKESHNKSTRRCVKIVIHGSKGVMNPVKWDKEATEKGK